MKKKINIYLILIAVVAIILTLFFSLTIFNEQWKKQIHKDLNISTRVLVDSGAFEDKNPKSLHFDSKGLRITWIDHDGKVLYDNDADADTMENHMGRPEVKQAFAKGVGEAVRRSETLNKSTYYYAERLEDGTVLRVAKEEANMFHLMRSIIPMLLLIIIVIMAMCIILAKLLTRNLMRPIEELARNLDEYSEGTAYKELVPFVNMIRKQHVDILKAAKMRQDFTANVSHELKTPLTAISGYAELMENRMVGEEEVVSFSAKIRKNTERLLALINDIIKLSELDSVEEQTQVVSFDLYTVVIQCVEMLKDYGAQRGVSLSYSGETAMIMANRDMICELVNNLCNNAIRYNNIGGKVEVEVRNQGDYVSLKVKDNGIGISPEHQQRIFERFYRVDKSRSKQTGGTGLGLAIVKHVAAIHNATIELESQVGKGTSITVVFEK